MAKPIIATVMNCALQAVIWQPYTEDRGLGEPAILVERDATGLLILTQEGCQVLIQPETLPALAKELKRLSAGGRNEH